MEINYLAIIVCAIIAMALGALWYGPLFGKKWLKVIGADKADLEARKKMQQSAGPLYFIQFILTLFQVLVLAHLINDAEKVGGLERSLWIWAAFIMPMLAANAMWNNDSKKVSWTRFLIQSSYQLTLFIIFGLILHYWK